MTAEAFSKLALSFPDTEEKPHFDRISFKITGKRIFATMDKKGVSANVKLSPQDQKQFCSLGEEIEPVPNKWGLQGWTTFRLPSTSDDIILAALETAHHDALLSRKPNKK